MDKLYRYYIEVHSVESNVDKDKYSLYYPKQLWIECAENELQQKVNELIEDAAQVTTPDYFELEIGDIDYTIEKKEMLSIAHHVFRYVEDNLQTVKSLADTLGVDRKTVYNILNGKSISKDTKRKLADLMGIKYSEFPKEE